MWGEMMIEITTSKNNPSFHKPGVLWNVENLFAARLGFGLVKVRPQARSGRSKALCILWTSYLVWILLKIECLSSYQIKRQIAQSINK